MKVEDVYNLIKDCHGFDGFRTHYAVSYGDTRTILYAFDRKLEAYAIYYRGAVVIIPKRGGYLAYTLCLKDRWMYPNDKYTSSATLVASLMDSNQALEEIHHIRKNNLGKTYIRKGLEREIYKRKIIEQL